MNNLPLLHLYTVLEFIFLSLFYRAVLKELKLKYFDQFIGLVAAFIILNTLFIQPITTFNSISKTITQIIYIIYSLSYFFGLPKRENQLLNLINSAILVYYSGSLFIFMFTNVLSILQDLYKYFWLANALLYLLFQLLVLYGLWKTGLRQMRSSP